MDGVEDAIEDDEEGPPPPLAESSTKATLKGILPMYDHHNSTTREFEKLNKIPFAYLWWVSRPAGDGDHEPN